MLELNYKILFENLPVPYQVLDQDCNIVAVNEKWIEISQYTEDEILNTNIAKYISNEYIEKFHKRSKKLDISSQIPTNTLSFTCKDGGKKEIEITGQIEKNDDGKYYSYCIFNDITHKKQMQDKVYYIAHYDTLTNLPNKASLKIEIRHTLNRGKRNRKKSALLLLGLDFFTEINEEYGNKYGDMILQEIARELESVVRKSDYLARLKGDIFAIVLEDVAPDANMEIILSKFLNVVNRDFIVEKKNITVSSTIGYLTYQKTNDTIEQLISNTEIALILAKSKARGSYREYINS